MSRSQSEDMLKIWTRHYRETICTRKLLKTSLGQMGIDLWQAEQLVSVCSWYVYRF